LRLGKQVEKGVLSESELKAIMARLKILPAFSGYSRCDLMIEAITENFGIKGALFAELAAVVSKSCIIASNTSSISITSLAARVTSPERFIGLHFMNPVPVMKLIEIIRGLQTSEETFQAALSFAAKLNKVAVVGVDSPGFIVNRVLCPMINEAIFLLQEGVAAKDIDAAMKLGTNQPMGPLELADFVGLDTLLSILRVLHNELGEDKYRPCPLLVNYVAAGWYGRKSGRGFYKY
jgi:3-hydroxybutyryl-CoA dehydrogenase